MMDNSWIPDFPANKADQRVSTSQPKGVTVPKPVITTRRDMEGS